MRRWTGGRADRRTVLAALVVVVAGCSTLPVLEVGEVEFTAPPGSLAPNLAADGDRVILTWLEPTDAGHALRAAVQEHDEWRVAGTIVENDSLFVNWADIPSLLILPDGQWLAHWLQKIAAPTYAYHVHLARSADAGATWDGPVAPHGDLSPTEHGFVGMVPWNDGAALVWLDGRKTARAPAGETAGGEQSIGEMTLRFTTLDGAGLPAPDVEIDGRVCDCCQTDLARSADGLIAVFRDRSPEEIRDIAVSRYEAGAWTPSRTVAADGWHYPGCPVNGPAIVAWSDTAAVAWYTAANDTVKVQLAWSTDGGQTFGAPVRINDGRPVGRVDVARMNGGAVVVSWIEEVQIDDESGERVTEGEIRLRVVSAEGRTGPAYTVARTAASRAAGFPRLARTAANLVVAWTAPGPNGGVRVASVLQR